MPEEDRAAHSAAWGVVAVLFGGAAMAAWLAAATSGSKSPIFPTCGFGVLLFPPGNWQRVALIVPLILGVLLTAPGWVLWLFLPAKQRQDFLALNGKFIE